MRLPITTQTLEITLGGTDVKPTFANGSTEAREVMSMTVSFHPDIIDGAPAVRIARRLKEPIETRTGLSDSLSTHDA